MRPVSSQVCVTPIATHAQVYLDVNLEGQSIGRIEIELFPDNAAVGAARFKDLAVGKEGVFRLILAGRIAITLAAYILRT